MAKRFAIYPGTIRSHSDGQEHYISGGELIRLYGLDFKECFIVGGRDGELLDPSLLPLYPLSGGRYKESLSWRKASDFQDYLRARKLYDFHKEGGSPHKHLRKTMMERFGKSCEWHEKHWPDFRAVYDQYQARKGR